MQCQEIISSNVVPLRKAAKAAGRLRELVNVYKRSKTKAFASIRRKWWLNRAPTDEEWIRATARGEVDCEEHMWRHRRYGMTSNLKAVEVSAHALRRARRRSEPKI